MTQVRVSGGYLNISVPGNGEIDNTLPGGSGGYPDNSLPGNQPGIDNSLPAPPPGIWPPPSFTRPIVPVGPDNSLPVQPGTIWPTPGRPNRPDQGLPGSGGQPDNTLPGGQGGEINNGLPSKTYWMLAYSPSLGWKYIAVDPSLSVGNQLPPTAQPK